MFNAWKIVSAIQKIPLDEWIIAEESDERLILKNEKRPIIITHSLNGFTYCRLLSPGDEPWEGQDVKIGISWSQARLRRYIKKVAALQGARMPGSDISTDLFLKAIKKDETNE